jgi:ABC-2 type transport system permease protein
VDGAEPVNDVAAQLRTAGQYPLGASRRGRGSACSRWSPLPCSAATPAGVLEGAHPLSGALAAVVALVAAVTALHWRAAVARYSSAS